MDIELNGRPHHAKEDQTVQELIDQLDLTRQALAVAINREVVPRDLWPQRCLLANDRVELVRPIGGG
jgi:sulfur carrier protein